VGALYLRRRPRVRLVPLLDGGGQENGWRGGTLNVPGIVGFGAAAALAGAEQSAEAVRLEGLRNRLETALAAALEVRINSRQAPRLPQTSSLTFAGLRAAHLLASLRGLAVSTGSACASGHPSHVLKAMGHSDADASASLRFSLGRFTTTADVEAAIEQVIAAVGHARREAFHPSNG
jgi:cysteine desulfurase